MTPNLTLYVPCFNAAPCLERCLRGVYLQTLRPAEVLVIDDGSLDETIAIASRFPVRVIRHGKNKGLSAARNTAIFEARHDLLASLDADCVPQPGWLAALAPMLADPRTALAGGKLVETVLDSTADRWRRAHLSQDWGEQRRTNPPFMFGNNLLARRTALQQAGGYDERLRTNGEDVDISRRVRALGFDCVYEPTAVVHHLRRDSTRSVLRMFWRYREGYERKLALQDVWKNWRYLHFGRARSALLADWRAGRYELLGLDLLAFAYPVWLDLHQVQRRRQTAPAARPQPEA